MSLSSRRAWIEISNPLGGVTTSTVSLSSRRAWIEIKNLLSMVSGKFCRSPHGERGLKLVYVQCSRTLRLGSLSSRRAWIEIAYVVSPSNNSLRSLSSRRAWIEIKSALTKIYWFCCRSPHGERGLKFVAPFLIVAEVRVALLTESVDWNNKSVRFIPPEFMSLSSRRAWIEIESGTVITVSGKGRSPHGERGLKLPEQ